MTIKAIETFYKGYRFRSRLEARWSVFFDYAGIEWLYEPEGFDLGKYGYYLPDFFLPKENVWVEVKPKEMNEVEREKVFALSSACGIPVACLNQIPDPSIAKFSYRLLSIRHYIGAESECANQCFFADQLISFYLENACGNVEDLSASETMLKDALSFDVEYYRHKYNKDHPTHFINGYIKEVECFRSDSLFEALTKARQARFEHGEKP